MDQRPELAAAAVAAGVAGGVRVGGAGAGQLLVAVSHHVYVLNVEELDGALAVVVCVFESLAPQFVGHGVDLGAGVEDDQGPVVSCRMLCCVVLCCVVLC